MQIAIVDENRLQFAFAFGLLGLGATLVGVGRWVMGLGIAPFEEAMNGPRRAMLATAAGWIGGLGVITGVARLLTALFATPESAVDGGALDIIVGVLGWIGTSVSLIILGWLGIKGPPPTWACGVLIFGGVAGLLTFLPLFWYLALIVFVITNLLVQRRGAGVAAA